MGCCKKRPKLNPRQSSRLTLSVRPIYTTPPQYLPISHMGLIPNYTFLMPDSIGKGKLPRNINFKRLHIAPTVLAHFRFYKNFFRAIRAFSSFSLKLGRFKGSNVFFSRLARYAILEFWQANQEHEQKRTKKRKKKPSEIIPVFLSRNSPGAAGKDKGKYKICNHKTSLLFLYPIA